MGPIGLWSSPALWQVLFLILQGVSYPSHWMIIVEPVELPMNRHWGRWYWLQVAVNDWPDLPYQHSYLSCIQCLLRDEEIKFDPANIASLPKIAVDEDCGHLLHNRLIMMMMVQHKQLVDTMTVYSCSTLSLVNQVHTFNHLTPCPRILGIWIC